MNLKCKLGLHSYKPVVGEWQNYIIDDTYVASLTKCLFCDHIKITATLIKKQHSDAVKSTTEAHR